jgi:hypothetical protein
VVKLVLENINIHNINNIFNFTIMGKYFLSFLKFFIPSLVLVFLAFLGYKFGNKLSIFFILCGLDIVVIFFIGIDNAIKNC